MEMAYKILSPKNWLMIDRVPAVVTAPEVPPIIAWNHDYPVTGASSTTYRLSKYSS